MNNKIKYGRRDKFNENENDNGFLYPSIYDSVEEVIKNEGVTKDQVVAIIPAHLLKTEQFEVIHV